MKSFITSIIVFCFFVNINAQSWVKPGSVWHYDFWNIGFVGFNKYEYKSDTLIQGHLCQKMTKSDYYFYSQPDGSYLGGGPHYLYNYYTFSSGDSVFYFQNLQFNLLYNFGANIGDSWVLSNDTDGGCLPVITHVLNKGSLQINNQTRRWIEIKTNSGGKYFHRGIAIEGIGIAAVNNPLQSGVGQSLFPQEVACDTNLNVEYNFYNFKCFTDSLNDFNYNPTNGDCEYLLNHVGINELKATSKIQIFPNPSADVLHISNADNSALDFMLIKLYNIQGILVKEIKIEPNQFQFIIDIQSFSTGMYFGKIISESFESISFKFVKE